LANDHQGSHRWAYLRVADGGDVRLALAALNKESLRPYRLHGIKKA
jgi:hypothetical protein